MITRLYTFDTAYKVLSEVYAITDIDNMRLHISAVNHQHTITIDLEKAIEPQIDEILKNYKDSTSQYAAYHVMTTILEHVVS